MTSIPRQVFIEMITKMNYNIALERRELVVAMQLSIIPLFPVGNDQDGQIYRIAPRTCGVVLD